MRVVATIQARMGSTRLPGKVLRLIHGRPMVERIAERLSYSKEIASLVLACSHLPADDRLAVCWTEQVALGVVRGSETLLDQRLLMAAYRASADAIVRVTGDCPLVDAEIVDELVRRWRANPQQIYVSNVHPNRTYPDGLDVEVIPTRTLQHMVAQTDPAWDHEALTTNIWEGRMAGEIGSMDLPGGQNLGELRWTVDRSDDLYFVRWVYDQLPDGFSWQEVLALRDAWADHVSLHWEDAYPLVPTGPPTVAGEVALRFGK